MTSATFSLFFTGNCCEPPVEPMECSLFTLTKSWNVDEVTWSNADANTKWENTDLNTVSNINPNGVVGGGDYSRDNYTTTMTVDTNQWQNYDVTQAMKDIIENNIPYYGFLVKPYLECKGRYYNSSENNAIEKRPKLEITYKSTDIIHHGSPIKCEDRKVSILYKSHSIIVTIPAIKISTLYFYDARGVQQYQYSGNGNSVVRIPKKSILKGKIYLVHVKGENRNLASPFVYIQ